MITKIMKPIIANVKPKVEINSDTMIILMPITNKAIPIMLKITTITTSILDLDFCFERFFFISLI